MQAPTTTPPPARTRRPRRLGIDAHTEFVGTLVTELDSAVARLQAAARRRPETGAEGDVELFDPFDIDRPAGEVLRLVRLLEAIDGPGDHRRMQLVSFPEILEQAAKSVDVAISVRGRATQERFLADSETMLLGLELVLVAFATDSSPVAVGLPNDRVVLIDGPFDLTDERRAWHLRCGRRVLEGENCRVRLVGGRGGYRLEIRALEP